MRIGWNGGGHHRSPGAIRDEARRASAEGFASFWLSQIAGPDSLTAIAAIAADAPSLELGTSIVPLYGRHPIALAAQGLTAGRGGTHPDAARRALRAQQPAVSRPHRGRPGETA